MDEEQIEEGIDSGFKLVCDECDSVGSNDYGYPHWQLQPDGELLCYRCVETREHNLKLKPIPHGNQQYQTKVNNMNQDSHPRLKNLIFTETQAERIEAKKTKANAEKTAQRRAIESHQSRQRDIRNPDDFSDMWEELGYV